MKHLQLIVIGVSLGWLIGMSESPVISSVITSLLSVLVILLTALSGLKSNSENDNPDATKVSKLLTNGISSLPVMLVLLGIVLGAIIGVYTRTHSLLSPNEDDGVLHTTSLRKMEAESYGIDVDAMVAKYKKYGIPDSLIANRALNIELPADSKSFKEHSPLAIQISNQIASKSKTDVQEGKKTVVMNETPPAYKRSVLYSLNSDECESLCGYVGTKFMKKLKGYSEDDIALQKVISEYQSNPEKLEEKIKQECKCRN